MIGPRAHLAPSRDCVTLEGTIRLRIRERSASLSPLVASRRLGLSTLRHRDFALLFSGTIVSHSGDLLQSMAQSFGILGALFAMRWRPRRSGWGPRLLPVFATDVLHAGVHGLWSFGTLWLGLLCDTHGPSFAVLTGALSCLVVTAGIAVVARARRRGAILSAP